MFGGRDARHEADSKVSKDADTLSQGDHYEESETMEQGDLKSRILNGDNKQKVTIIIICGAVLLFALIGFSVKTITDKDKAATAKPEVSTATADNAKITGNQTVSLGSSDEDKGIQPASNSESPTTSKPNIDIVNPTFTDDQIRELRSAGYTGYEIDKAMTRGAKAEDLLSDAKIDKTKYLQGLYKELLEETKDGASQKYLDLVNNTWLTGTEKPVTIQSGDYSSIKKKCNARYEKIPARGAQLWIKLTFEADEVNPANPDPIFYNLRPDQYAKLKDKGNILVDYKDVAYGGFNYITEVNEIPLDK